MSPLRWIPAYCLTLVALSVTAENSYPPPTGPYTGNGEQTGGQWAPDPNQPSPFDSYPATGGYDYQQAPAYSQPGYGQYDDGHGQYYAGQGNPAPGYGYYSEPYPPAPVERRSYSFNPYNMMNGMGNPMRNMFGSREYDDYGYQDAPPPGWGAQQGYAQPYANPYPQYGYGSPAYGSGYPDAQGYYTQPGYGYPADYGQPQYGYQPQYEYQEIPPQQPSRPYSNSYYQQPDPSAAQPQAYPGQPGSHAALMPSGDQHHDSMPADNPAAPAQYGAYPSRPGSQNPSGFWAPRPEDDGGAPPMPQGWVALPDQGGSGSPGSQGYAPETPSGTQPPAQNSYGPGYQAGMGPDLTRYPVSGQSDGAATANPPSVAMPQPGQGYMVDGHTPVFRPLTEEELGTAAMDDGQHRGE